MFRMMYDTFHANIEEKNLSDAIDAAMPWTKIVHICENDRSTPDRGTLHGRKHSMPSGKQIGMAGWLSKRLA